MSAKAIHAVVPGSSMPSAKARALEVLKAAYGPDAAFREGQWEAIEPLLEGGRRLLVVQRTGWGKSVVYFTAARMLSESGKGPTLIVSPLLSLMRNQVAMAQRFGVRASTIHSANRDEWPEAEQAFLSGQTEALLVSPERLANAEFQSRVLEWSLQRGGLLVIDEAHCISDWGHDFRPDYRRIMRLAERLHPGASVLATTATANARVVADLEEQFGPFLDVHRGELVRTSLRLMAFPIADYGERLAWLAKYIPRFPGTGIVYALTVHDAEQAAKWLRQNGIDAAAYHADLTNEERLVLEDRFVRNDLKALVATTALGMGYDKVDVGFVVHYQMPGSAVAYYQQVGRAGRSLDTAFATLLSGEEDEDITRHFIDSARPRPELFELVGNLLLGGPKAFTELLRATGVPMGTLKHALEILEADEAVTRVSGGFSLVGGGFTYDRAHTERVRAERVRELGAMRAYVATSECRMQYIARELGDESTLPCGRCDNCLPHAPVALDEAKVAEALRFLRQGWHPIKPITRLPKGLEEELCRQRTFRDSEKLLEGIALSAYNDAGWGKLLRQGKYETMEFDDQLVAASVDAIRESGFVPDWIAWIPSSRPTSPVASFARRLASALGIEAVEAVFKSKENPPQKAMTVADAQVLNVWDAFEVHGARPGACLLVDDVVDSGWTLAVAGMRLRRAGTGPVMPFALATARPRRQA